ncbi:MAG: acetoin utilization protein [Bacteroidetes bacterium QH_7_62_13]|jgi:predicted transcriptional regulator|nr:MAG: acetoin utilization protein [Bacteroidetes bacterium QH_1_61_8]PSQ76804.1 MAG: acetoin utilization protein [Bacteroidetes bacterium QH_7_62_13]
MEVRDAIDPSTPALQVSDSVETALGLLMEHHVNHLPVVDDEGDLAGMLSEERLMDAEGPDAEIDSLVVGRPVSVPPEAHIFEAARSMVEHDLSTIPVADTQGQYHGLIRRHDIFDTFAQMLSTQQSGAIVALEVDPRDYALANLVRLIEQNEGKVLAVASEEPETSTGKIRVTLKLNVKDTSRIRHVLEHNGYHVVASFGEAEGEIEELVEEFVRYLEV